MRPHPKTVIAIIPISTTNGATATGEAIDTKGYDFCSISIVASTANVVSNTLSVLKIEEGDTTSSYATFSGAVQTTDYTVNTTAFTQFGAGSNQNVWSFHVNTTGRKRYLRVSASPQTTMVIGGSAHLHMGEVAPSTSATAGSLSAIYV